MATIPTMITWTDDQLVTPELLDEQIRDAGNFNLKRPGAVVSVSDSWTKTGNGTHLPTFDTVQYDTDGMVDLAGFSYGLTVQTPGIYLVTAHYDIHADTSNVTRGTMFANILNGSDECCRMQMSVDWSLGTGWIGSISNAKFLNAGDQITYQMYFAASASINWTFGTTTRTSLSALWIGS